MKKSRLIFILIVVIMVMAACQKKQDKASAAAAPAAPAAADGNLLVEVKHMAPEKFEHFFTVSGSLEAIQDAFISAETSGQIKTIPVQEGQRVQKGELLVTLNSDITRNAVAEVKNALDLARTVFLKRQGLWEKNIGSEIQYLGGQDQQGNPGKPPAIAAGAARPGRDQGPVHRHHRQDLQESGRTGRARAAADAAGQSEAHARQRRGRRDLPRQDPVRATASRSRFPPIPTGGWRPRFPASARW